MEPCNDKLCQFEDLDDEKSVDNEEDAEEVDMIQDEESENDDVHYGENDCHLCEDKFPSLDNLCEHFRTNHEEYFLNTQKGVAQYASSRNQKFY